MRQSFYSLGLLLSLSSFSIGTNAYSYDPIMHFVIQWMYFNSATTTCHEIVSCPDGREGINNNIEMLLRYAGQIPGGRGNLSVGSFQGRIDALFEYCRRNPNDMFGKALLVTNEDILRGIQGKNKRHGSSSRMSGNRGGYREYKDYFSQNYNSKGR